MSRREEIGVQALTELALDLRWSWNRSTDELWAQLDPELWASTHNPWAVLQTVSPGRVQDLLGRPDYRQLVKDLIDRRHQYLSSAAWFQQAHRESPLTRVAYFSMEFGVSEALPIYSGGLGNVAGDQLKAASDLGVPVIGVGVLYQQGYFRKVIAADGSQEALYPYNDPDQLPITPVRNEGGDLLRLPVLLPGQKVWLRAWQVQVGRVVLYLLDSNDPANPPAVRGITSELYGGGADLRLQQELLLGIGGWRCPGTLRTWPEVSPLNAGHAALSLLQRRGQRREPAPWRGEAAHLPVALSSLAERRGSGGPRHQRHPHAVMGVPGGGRVVDEDVRNGAVAPNAGVDRARRGERVRHRAVGSPYRRAQGPRRLRPRANRAAGCRHGLTSGRGVGDVRRFGPHGTHARIRATVRRLQASQSLAPRSGPAAPDPDERGAAGPARHRRQGASRRSWWAGADPGVDPVHSPSGRSPPGDFHRRLRHAPGRAPRARRRCLGEYAAAAVGSQWNERDESARQRRPESLGARRLVGRGVRAGGRLGAGRRPGAWRRSWLGRRRGRRPVYAARA